MDRFLQFFSSAAFLPHGTCFLWQPEIFWLHIFSDALIGVSYFSIPLALYVFSTRRSDLKFKSIFFLFTAFILLCGATHFFSIMTIWNPFYGIEGLLKLATAVVSAVTAYMLWSLLPVALTVPGPDHYREQNEKLEAEIASRREAEAKLRDLNQNLERLVSDRTAELELARREAERANQSKSEFLATMGHEIRTPLNAILGLAQALEIDPDRNDFKECLGLIRSSGDVLRNLLNDLLDFSKIEAGRLTIVEQDTDLEEFAEQVQALWDPLAEEKGLAFDVQLEAPAPRTCLLDPHRLLQIVNNLISNAIKYTNAGSVCVAMRQSGEAAPLRIEVTDTGIGIPEELHQSLFQPFDQLTEERSRQYGGTGLGLAIARRLAELMGGSIAVDSTPGEGSRFTVTLPVARVPGEAAGAAPGQADLGHGIGAAHPAALLRILSIDDNAHNRRVIDTLLTALGHEVRSAASGAAALEILDGESFDVALVDIRMPGMNGFELARRIRARDDAGARMPLIAVTATPRSGIDGELREAGFSGYLAKPVDLAEMAGALRSYGHPAEKPDLDATA